MIINKKGIAQIAILIIIAIVILIFFGAFNFLSIVGGDKVGITSAGPDNNCGTEDDTNVYVEGEKICTSIQLNPPSVFASLSHPSVPRILASGYAYDPTRRGFSCQTPPRILQLQGKENLNGIWQPSDKQFIAGGFSTYEAFGQAYSDYYRCGPYTILNDKIYSNEPLTVIDNKITQAKAEVYFTVCTDQAPQSSNRQYSCERFERTGITALEFDILPKKTEGFCSNNNDCIDIECVSGTPAAECRNYDCINNKCILNIPTSSVLTTSVSTTVKPGETTIIQQTTTTQETTTTKIQDDTKELSLFDRIRLFFRRLFSRFTL